MVNNNNKRWIHRPSGIGLYFLLLLLIIFLLFCIFSSFVTAMSFQAKRYHLSIFGNWERGLQYHITAVNKKVWGSWAGYSIWIQSVHTEAQQQRIGHLEFFVFGFLQFLDILDTPTFFVPRGY